MTSVTEGSHKTRVDSLPLDVGLFEDIVTLARLMKLNTSTRADIDARTNELVSHLRELLARDDVLGPNEDDNVMRLFLQAYRHLELTNRPTRSTPAFDAFTYMQETATLADALLKLYVANNGARLQ